MTGVQTCALPISTIPTYFMKLAGIGSLTINATSLASMQGMAQQDNVAVILDATQSMSSAPPSGSCPSSAKSLFSCALYGVESLMQAVNPCGGVSNCGASNAKFRLALFSFPNVTTATVANDWTCGSTPTNEPYTLPLSTGYQSESTTLSGYTPLGYATASTSNGKTTYTSKIPVSTYEDTPVNTNDGDVNGFITDYYSQGSSSPANLNSSSSAVEAVTGCMKNPGGESTYYTSVIYAAQAALAAEQAKYGGNNYLIILSDGQANADNSKFPSSNYVAASGQNSQASYGFGVTTNSTSNSTTNLTGTSKSFGYYPDFNDECQQAIMAAQAAQSAGTTVVTVAFGSETSASCSTDSTTIATATSGQSAFTYKTITPCLTMKNMASPPSNGFSYFFADSASSGNGCTDDLHNNGVGSIGQIFGGAIASLFTTPRLLPANAQ